MGCCTFYTSLKVQQIINSLQHSLQAVVNLFMLWLSYENSRSLNALQIEKLNSDWYSDPSATALMKSLVTVLYKQQHDVAAKINLPLDCHFKFDDSWKVMQPLATVPWGTVLQEKHPESWGFFPMSKTLHRIPSARSEFHVMWQVGQTKLGHPTQRQHILQFPRLSRLVRACWSAVHSCQIIRRTWNNPLLPAIIWPKMHEEENISFRVQVSVIAI